MGCNEQGNDHDEGEERGDEGEDCGDEGDTRDGCDVECDGRGRFIDPRSDSESGAQIRGTLREGGDILVVAGHSGRSGRRQWVGRKLSMNAEGPIAMGRGVQ